MDAEDGIARKLDALREHVENSETAFDGNIIHTTVTIGMAYRRPGESIDDWIQHADKNLYSGKNSGRNRVVSYMGEVPADEDLAPAVNAAEIEATRAAKTAEKMAEAAESEPVNKAEKADELWDIYDANKELTGRTMKRNDFTMKDGDYHLTVLGVVMKPSGEFLVTRRVMSKSWAPGWWEVSGGAAVAGEKSYDAVVREIREETGLDVSGAEGGYMFSYKRDNPDEGDNYFVDVYRFVMDFDDDQVQIQREEADGYMLASAEDIAELGADGVFLHYDSIKEVFNT